MANTHTTLASLFSAIADAIRAKTGGTDQIVADNFPSEIAAIETGIQLPALASPGTAADLLSGKQLIDGDGNIVDGTMTAAKTPVFEAISSTYQLSGNYYAYTVTVSQEIDSLLGLTATTSNGYVFSAPYKQSSNMIVLGILPGSGATISKAFCSYTIDGNTITFEMFNITGDDPGAISDGMICYLPK